MQLLFNNAIFRHEPYPIGLARPIFDTESYMALVDSFPPIDLLPHWGGEGYHKYALNERMPGYHEYLAEHPLWWAFHTSVKDKKFPEHIISMIRSHGIDIAPSPKWTTRFEFAAMPAEGGKIAPHNDLPSKAVTLVFSILKPGEWDISAGGGLDVLEPLDPKEELRSYHAPLEKFRKAHTFEYHSNQCVIFVRSENSWHSVGPMIGTDRRMRRTITLNIERHDA